MQYQSAIPKDTLLKDTYLIESVIGQGGFGITYLVRHKELTNRRFVVKEFYMNGLCIRINGKIVQADSTHSPKFEQYKAKFIEEAETISRLHDCPEIIEVIDFFRENNTAYMVMPYISEQNLEQYVKLQPNNRLSEDEAISYILQAAKGLAAAHKKHILHRDIKPSNLLRTVDGKIVLIDFGTAREYISQDQSQAMSVIYTPGYAPKEQYSYSAKRGDFSDIYSLGATLYRLVTGQVPKDAIYRLDNPLPEPILLNPAISHKLNAVILKAMDMKPENRFQHVEEFIAALAEDKTIMETANHTISVDRKNEKIVLSTKKWLFPSFSKNVKIMGGFLVGCTCLLLLIGKIVVNEKLNREKAKAAKDSIVIALKAKKIADSLAKEPKRQNVILIHSYLLEIGTDLPPKDEFIKSMEEEKNAKEFFDTLKAQGAFKTNYEFENFKLDYGIWEKVE